MGQAWATELRMDKAITDYMDALANTLDAMPTEQIARLAEYLDRAQQSGRLIAICGNGGSASTAQHLAADLNKNTHRCFRCLCLSDNIAHLTALANDEDYEEVFARQLSLLSAGDLLLVISASGDSPNIVRAATRARKLGCTVLGLLGMGGGDVRTYCDAAIVVPSDDYGVIEDSHMAIGHALVMALRGVA